MFPNIIDIWIVQSVDNIIFIDLSNPLLHIVWYHGLSTFLIPNKLSSHLLANLLSHKSPLSSFNSHRKRKQSSRFNSLTSISRKLTLNFISHKAQKFLYSFFWFVTYIALHNIPITCYESVLGKYSRASTFCEVRCRV